MKIALILPHAKIGGMEQHVLTLANELKKQGDLPTVVFLFGKHGPMSELFDKHGISQLHLNVKNGHDPILAIKFYNFLQHEEPTVVHLHVATFVVIIAMMIYKKAPLVFTEHMTKDERQVPLSAKFLRYLLNMRVNAVIAVSRSTMKGLVRITPSMQPKITVVYNGIDIDDAPETISAISHPINTIRVGAVGRLAKGKGWESFIKVANKLLKTNKKFHFIIIGDGPMRQELESMSAKYALNNHVEFMGFCKNPRAIVNSFDIYLMLSEHEACPLTLLEAFAEKVPVAGFLPLGGVKEINRGVAPLLENRSVDDLATVIINLISSQELMNDQIDKQYKIISSELNAQNMKNNIYKIYNSVAR